MNEKKKDDKKSPEMVEKITFTLEQVQKILKQVLPYYPAVKWGARIFGYKIPDEVDEIVESIKKGEPPDMEKLQRLGEQMNVPEPKVGEPVLTRRLAEEAYFLHYGAGQMSTREIAEEFTRRGNPCSHATVARWIGMVENERAMDKVARVRSILKYVAIIGAMIGSMLVGKFLLG